LPNAVVIRHVAFEDLGSLERPLVEAGYHLQWVEAGRDAIDQEAIARADLLIVLGGPLGVYDVAHYPFLKDELTALKIRIAADKPTLGVCLGAQLIAAALGAKVYPGAKGKEIGWSPLTAAPGEESGLLAPMFADGVKALHWHGDTFDLPAGARRLAGSAKYENQAYRVGKRTLGLQFHVEATAAGLERWYIGHCCELGLAKISIPELRASSQAEAPRTEVAARQVLAAWLKEIEASL